MSDHDLSINSPEDRAHRQLLEIDYLRERAIEMMKAAGLARWKSAEWPTDRTIWDAIFEDAFDALHGVARVVPLEAAAVAIEKDGTFTIQELVERHNAENDLTRPK